MNKKKVLVRVDANQTIGIGHTMRCLAVAEYLIAQGYELCFAMREIPEQLVSRLESAGIQILRLSDQQITASGFRDLAARLEISFLILDGYHLDGRFEQVFLDTPVRTLRFDDYMPGKRCSADVVVNASPHAERPTYAHWAPDAELLLGPRYIAFRSDMISSFYKKQSKAEKSGDFPAGKSILVNFGGSDPLDMTVATVSALASALPDVMIEAVTGAAYPAPDRLADLGIKKFEHHHNSGNLAQIMQRARLAVSAGGLTVQELALFRIPTILAITAENQIKGAHVSWCHTLRLDWQKQDKNTDKIIEDIVRESLMLWQSADERTKIIDRIPKELDIHGAKRIAEALTKEKQHDR